MTTAIREPVNVPRIEEWVRSTIYIGETGVICPIPDHEDMYCPHCTWNEELEAAAAAEEPMTYPDQYMDFDPDTGEYHDPYDYSFENDLTPTTFGYWAVTGDGELQKARVTINKTDLSIARSVTPKPGDEVSRIARRLASALAIPQSKAIAYCDIGTMLSKYEQLRPLLEVGAFSFEHLRVLADCLFGVTDDHRLKVEDEIAGLLYPQRPSQAVPGTRTLRRKVTDIVDRIQPTARPADPEELGIVPPPEAQLCFDVDTRSPERTVFHITMPSDEGLGFLRIVDAVADAHDTTRAKALTELVHGQARNVSVTLNCYRSLDTAETHLESTGLDRVATKRWLARVTDLCIAGHSEIEGYRNSDHQRATIAGVDGTCRFPGCDAPAATAQIDHVTKYDGGGKTATWAEQSLCPACHSLKTRGLWDVTRNPDGSCWWTSIADGHTVVDTPTGPLADACLTFDTRLHRKRKALTEHNALRLEHREKTRAAAAKVEAQAVPF